METKRRQKERDEEVAMLSGFCTMEDGEGPREAGIYQNKEAICTKENVSITPKSIGKGLLQFDLRSSSKRKHAHGSQGLCAYGEAIHAHGPAETCMSCTFGKEWMGCRGELSRCVGQQWIIKLGCEKEMSNSDRTDLGWIGNLLQVSAAGIGLRRSTTVIRPGMGRP
ncbi:hypothetical protein VNO78_08667 [Psophocarpus tetragonolobus]|uniref:Uncharacterized protein n=1 Tax=Psophocarpus tetragonolobus TaxID=3891 RepID=A0AAN9SWS2_PSOTE